jgi:hypothetical protein
VLTLLLTCGHLTFLPEKCANRHCGGHLSGHVGPFPWTLKLVRLALESTGQRASLGVDEQPGLYVNASEIFTFLLVSHNVMQSHVTIS